MPEQKNISAIVLDKEKRGETSVLLTAFSSEEGLVVMFKKMSSKKTSLVPDLFDEISCQVQLPEANASINFLQQFDILEHRESIGISYEKLCCACELTSIVKLNGAHIYEKQSLFSLLSKALESIEKSTSLAEIKIKFLYLLVKEQGYPIKEDFFKSLPEEDKNKFASILKTPISSESTSDNNAEKLYNALKYWVQTQTDIIV